MSGEVQVMICMPSYDPDDWQSFSSTVSHMVYTNEMEQAMMLWLAVAWWVLGYNCDDNCHMNAVSSLEVVVTHTHPLCLNGQPSGSFAASLDTVVHTFMCSDLPPWCLTGWVTGQLPLAPLAHTAINVYAHIFRHGCHPHLNCIPADRPLSLLWHTWPCLWTPLCIQSCLCTWMLHAYIRHIDQDSTHTTTSNDAPPWLSHPYWAHLKRWPPLTPLAHIAVSLDAVGMACTTP